MNEEEIRVLIHHELKARGIVGGPVVDLIEGKILDAIRQLVPHQITPANACDSARRLVAVLRGLWHALQPWVDHQIDQLDALAGHPATGKAIATAIENVAAPFLRTPHAVEESQDDGA
jgi:hypothetical protein